MTPLRALRFDNQDRRKDRLLVSGWPKVIVREDCSQCSIDTEIIENVVGVPSLHGRLRAERVKERMRLGFRTRERAIAWIT